MLSVLKIFDHLTASINPCNGDISSGIGREHNIHQPHNDNRGDKHEGQRPFIPQHFLDNSFTNS